MLLCCDFRIADSTHAVLQDAIEAYGEDNEVVGFDVECAVSYITS